MLRDKRRHISPTQVAALRVDDMMHPQILHMQQNPHKDQDSGPQNSDFELLRRNTDDELHEYAWI